MLLGLAACATPPHQGAPGSDRYSQRHDSAPEHRPAPEDLPDPTPRAEPPSRYGNPASYSVHGKTYHVRDSAEGYQEEGLASWYGKKFHGHRTSSGEPYDMYKLSAAHKTLPLPTWARVTNLANGKSTILRINDRGPFHPDRIIDLSWAAAVKLDIADHGTGRVRVEAITPGDKPAPVQQARATAVAAAAPDDDRLYLQVGAFSRRESARDIVMDLVARFSFPVAVRPASDIYRVWVGPFGSDRARQQAREQLVAAGFDSPVRVGP
jgi:rare lipoprotein A